MPEFPEPAHKIQTDIYLNAPDLQACDGLTIRTIFDPSHPSMIIQVLSELVPVPRVIAERVIFTSIPSATHQQPGETQ